MDASVDTSTKQGKGVYRSRREILASVTALPLFTGTALTAHAERDVVDERFVARLASNTFLANHLLDVIEALQTPVDSDAVNTLVRQELALRTELASTLHVLRNKDRNQVVRLEQRALVKLFEQRSIAVVPYASELGPMTSMGAVEGRNR